LTRKIFICGSLEKSISLRIMLSIVSFFSIVFSITADEKDFLIHLFFSKEKMHETSGAFVIEKSIASRRAFSSIMPSNEIKI